MRPINRIGGNGRRAADRTKGAIAQGADGARRGLPQGGPPGLSQAIMEMEVEEQVGAARHERTNIPAAAPLIRYSPIAGARMARPPVLGRFLLGMLRTSSLPGPRGSLPGPSGCRGKSPSQASMANS